MYRVRWYEMVGRSIHRTPGGMEDMFGSGRGAEKLSGAVEQFRELLAVEHQKR